MALPTLIAILLSALVGVSLGLLGGGGSILAVPLLVIALNAGAGLAGHLRQGEIPLGLTAAFTAASLLGASVGGRLSTRIEPLRLRRAFAVFVVLVGLALLAANARPV